MKRESLHHIALIQSKFDEDLGTCFSDEEELILKNKAAAITDAINNEFKRLINKPDYWHSTKGPIPVQDLEDKHLASIPRHLIRNHVISTIDELPDSIRKEISARGWTINKQGYVYRGD